MKIALTGATGFIGSALIKYLSNNPSLTLSLFNKKRHSLFAIDSLKDLIKDKEIIIHLAGITYSSHIQNYYTNNVTSTLNLLEAIAKYNKKTPYFIFISSLAVYEEIFTEKLLKENIKTSPRNHYGVSKLLAEKIIEFYNHNKKIRSCILRVSNVYGPGMKNSTKSVINTFIDNILHDQTVTIDGNGNQKRDFIYIDDVIDAIIKCIYKNKRGNLIINICSSEEIRIIDVLRTIEDIMKKKVVARFNSNYLENGYWIGSNKKAFKTINFHPKVTFYDGLKRTISWYTKKSYSI